MAPTRATDLGRVLDVLPTLSRERGARIGPGVHVLAHRAEAVLLVPDAAPPVPLLVCFHGAGGSARDAIALVGDAARRRGVAVLAPSSQEATWDLLRGDPGRDASAVAVALAEAGTLLPLDLGRLAFGGFSDGASYALSLGLAHGDVLRLLIAFSPGFVLPPAEDEKGRPAVWVSHGTHDRVLAIDRCSRRIVPRLRAAGYAVDYHEFDGGHEVPPALVDLALAALLDGAASGPAG